MTVKPAAWRAFVFLRGPAIRKQASPRSCLLAACADGNIVEMTLPISKSELERLGFRLVLANQPEAIDLTTLRSVLDEYGNVLEVATDRVRRGLAVQPTPRVKSLETTLDKLRRNGGSGLRNMQDLAGMRIVTDDRTDQNGLSEAVVNEFQDDVRTPKIVDRRDQPIQGYRAVHIIVYPAGLPVEIQIRTRLQDEWANLFEKLADRIGRGIRYGEPPDQLDDNFGGTTDLRVQAVGTAMKLSSAIDVYERKEESQGAQLSYRLERIQLRALVREFGELIDAAFGA